MMECLEYLNQFSLRVDIPSTIIIAVFEYLIATVSNESTVQDLLPYYKVVFYYKVCVSFYVSRLICNFSSNFCIQKVCFIKYIWNIFSKVLFGQLNRSLLNIFLTVISLSSILILSFSNTFAYIKICLERINVFT